MRRGSRMPPPPPSRTMAANARVLIRVHVRAAPPFALLVFAAMLVLGSTSAAASSHTPQRRGEVLAFQPSSSSAALSSSCRIHNTRANIAAAAGGRSSSRGSAALRYSLGGNNNNGGGGNEEREAATMADPTTATTRMASATGTATAPTTSTDAATATTTPEAPTLDNYSIDSNGRIVGQIFGNHPTIADGDIVTTSPLRDFADVGAGSGGSAVQKQKQGQEQGQKQRQYREGMTVETVSGSRYVLGRPKLRQTQEQRQGAGVDADVDVDTSAESGGDEQKTMDIFGIRLPSLSLLPNANNDDNNDLNSDNQDPDPTLALPIMDQWRIQWNGRLMGSVLNHPVYDNGDVITTSALTQTQNLQDGDVVTTYSGSQYVLGRRLDGWQKVLGSIAEEATATAGVELPTVELPTVELPNVELPSVELPSVELPNVANLNVGDSIRLPSTPSTTTDDAVEDNGASSSASPPSAATSAAPAKDTSQLQLEPKFGGKKNSNVNNNSATTNNDKPSVASAPAPTLRQRRREATRRYNLTGQTAGRKRSGGSKFEYLISGKPFRTTSGKSNIYTAYISDDDGLPVTVMGDGSVGGVRSSYTEADAEAVAMKVSTNCEALKRENMNYDRIISGGYGNRFVKKYEFIDKWGGPQFPQNACALVIEAGHQDLKSVMYARGGRGEGGLDGPALRDAALAAARCVEAMHRVELVWTDIKPENFIVTTDSIGCDGDCPLVVKGIDLESAIPRGDTPVDYSPEASPPEFAVDFHDGRALDHVLEFTYDVWSLGMLLYELSTGKSYFEQETPEEITQMLSSPDFKVDLRDVKKNRLRNLIGQCLQTDPKKRPSITEVLLHPYFLTTGLGWY